jgi:DNA-binding sugar fermentation-stimulating protein
MPCQFVLQIVGITEGHIQQRPSQEYPTISELSNVIITGNTVNYSSNKDKENNKSFEIGNVVLAYTPSGSCDNLSNTSSNVLIAHCPPDEDEDQLIMEKIGSNQTFTHCVFLSILKEKELDENGNVTKIPSKKKKRIFKKTEDEDDDDDEFELEDNEQYIAINPKLGIEITESLIEKKLINLLPPVKTYKRNVPMYLEDKVDSVFSFMGFCEDNIPFIIDVNNVPFAEYKHGERRHEIGPGTPPSGNIKNRHFTKTAFFPGKDCDNTSEMIKRINDIITIKRESITRCYIAYIIQRTDISHFEISKYNPEYQDIIKKAINVGVHIVPIVISWTNEGVALFVTDSLPFLSPLS